MSAQTPQQTITLYGTFQQQQQHSLHFNRKCFSKLVSQLYQLLWMLFPYRHISCQRTIQRSFVIVSTISILWLNKRDHTHKTNLNLGDYSNWIQQMAFIYFFSEWQSVWTKVGHM